MSANCRGIHDWVQRKGDTPGSYRCSRCRLCAADTLSYAQELEGRLEPRLAPGGLLQLPPRWVPDRPYLEHSDGKWVPDLVPNNDENRQRVWALVPSAERWNTCPCAYWMVASRVWWSLPPKLALIALCHVLRTGDLSEETEAVVRALEEEGTPPRKRDDLRTVKGRLSQAWLGFASSEKKGLAWREHPRGAHASSWRTAQTGMDHLAAAVRIAAEDAVAPIRWSPTRVGPVPAELELFRELQTRRLREVLPWEALQRTPVDDKGLLRGYH